MDFRDISVIPSSDVSTLIVLHPLDHVAEPLVVLQKVLGEAAVAGVESLGLGTEYIATQHPPHAYKVDTFNWIYLASIKTLKRILCVLHLAAGGGVGVAGGGGLVPRLAPHGHHLDGQEGGVLGSAANRLIGEVVQSRRRPLLGPSPG